MACMQRDGSGDAGQSGRFLDLPGDIRFSGILPLQGGGNLDDQIVGSGLKRCFQKIPERRGDLYADSFAVQEDLDTFMGIRNFQKQRGGPIGGKGVLIAYKSAELWLLVRQPIWQRYFLLAGKTRIIDAAACAAFPGLLIRASQNRHIAS